jgi:eukaryotic-like serine/threonine-protein kinase
MQKSIGPYELVRRLGFGGMAEVHLALAHGASGFSRTVAIKTLLPGLVDDARCVRGLIREATLAAQLHHRNLVYVHGFGVDDGQYYIVMEYVDGGDLHGTVLPEPLALHVASELALGLAHVHAAHDDRGLPLGLVHRDLSPANVLVSSTGDVKLADLGIAKATALADRTEAGALRGTYAYMSREQIAGEPVTAAADQWGLAVVLAELITGVRVFAGDVPLDTMHAIERGERRLDGIAPDVRAVIESATHAEPTQRFRSIDELRIELERIRRTREPVGTVELAAWVQERA